MAGEVFAAMFDAASRTGGVDAGAVLGTVTSVKPYRVKIESEQDLGQEFLIPSPFIIEILEKDESKRATSHYHMSGEDWVTEPAGEGPHIHKIPPQETDTQLQKPLQKGDKIWMIPVKGSQEYLMLWRDLGGFK